MDSTKSTLTELQQQWTAVRAKLNADAGVYDPGKAWFRCNCQITKKQWTSSVQQGKA